MVAIYSRKSKYTETGDSVENQIQICKEHLKRFELIKSDKDYKIYEDEGFSGKNTERPMFKAMMNDVKNGLINTIICYRLDRISRKVSDFSEWLDTIQIYNVSFISVKESFDTSSPIGRAMIHIASVFSQLERETIAERIKDNKIEIAKTGRWQGGTPPIGFTVEQCLYCDENGHNRKQFYLKANKNILEYEYINTLFLVFKEKGSLSAVEKYCKTHHIKSPNGNYPDTNTIKQHLTNPVYASADKTAYKFLKNNNCFISCDESLFDGKYGMIGYSKTYETSKSIRVKNNIDNWIIAIGKHEPFITGKEWVSVLNKLNADRHPSYRFQTSEVALLSGLIRCSCGSPMLVKNIKKNSKGETVFYYVCLKKSKSGGVLCNSKNLNGPLVDIKIVNEINNILNNSQQLNKQIDKGISITQKANNTISNKIISIKKEICTNENNIKSLILKLTDDNITSLVAEQINIVIKQLTSDTNILKNKLTHLSNKLHSCNNNAINMDILKEQINNFKNDFFKLEHSQKIYLINSLVHHIDYKNNETFDTVLILDKFE